MKSSCDTSPDSRIVCGAIVNCPPVAESLDPVAIDERRSGGMWRMPGWRGRGRAILGRAYCREVKFAIIACFYLRPAGVAKAQLTSTSAFRNTLHQN